MGKRTKLILGIILGAVIVFSGALFGLAKFGVINIKGLADIITQNAGNNHSLELKIWDMSAQNTTAPIGANQQIKIVSNENNSIFFTATTNSSSIAKYTNIPSANYSVYATSCSNSLATQVIPPESLTPPQPIGTINIQIQKQCPDSGGVNPPSNPTKVTVPYRISTHNASYPNQSQMLSGIPIYYDNVSEQLSQNPTNPGWETPNGLFNNVPIGTHIFTINSSSSSHYNSSYQTLIKSISVTSASMLYFDLIKGTTINITQTPNFDFQGIVKDTEGNVLHGVTVEILCPDSPDSEKAACKSIMPVSKGTNSRAEADIQNTNGKSQNYLIQDIYNIARPSVSFSSYRIHIQKSGYFIDTNKNGTQDSNEWGWLDISKSDIIPTSQTSTKSLLLKDFVLTKSPPDQFTLAILVYKTDPNGGKLPVDGIRFKLEGNNYSEEKISAKELSWPNNQSEKIANIAFSNLDSINNAHYSLTMYQENLINGKQTIGISKDMISQWNNQKIVFKEFKIETKESQVNLYIKDANTKTPLQNAEVTILDYGCSPLGIYTAKTNGEGLVSFKNATITEYITTGLVNCSTKNLHVRVRMNEFSSREMQYGSAEILNIVQSGQVIYLSKNTNFLGGSITGTVKNSTTLEPIFGAKVMIYKYDRPDLQLKNTTSGTDGSFKFTGMTSGRYWVVAYSDEFVQGQDKEFRLIVEYASPDVINIELLLEPVLSFTNVIRLFCYNTNTLAVLPNAKITFASNNGVEYLERNTNSLGFAEFNINLVANYTAVCSVNNAGTIISNNIIINSMESVKNYESSNYYIGLNINLRIDERIDRVNITVVDQGYKPVVGATVTYGYDCIQPVEKRGHYSLKATTDTSGKVSLLDSFTDTENPCGYLNGKKWFTDGEFLNVWAEKDQLHGSIWQPLAKNPNSHDANVLIVLHSQSDIESGIYVESLMFDTQAGYYLMQDIVLEEEVNEKWQNSGLKISDILEDTKFGRIQSTAFFKPNNAGKFRATLPSFKLVSSETDWKPGQEAHMELDFSPAICNNTEGIFIQLPSGAYWSVYDRSYYDQHKDTIAKLDETLKSLMQQSKTISPLIIYLTPFMQVNGAFIPEKINCANVQNANLIRLSTEALNLSMESNNFILIRNILAHEYGHAIFQNMPAAFVGEWEKIYQIISEDVEARKIWPALTDSNYDYTFGGHPWDNPHELFASFYFAYFLYHDNLYGAINYHFDFNSSSQNTLASAWQLFAEQIGKVYSNDNSFFQTVSPLKSLSFLTTSQISSGIWLKENYDKLPVTQKLGLQLSIEGQRIKNIASSFRTATISMIKGSISIVNDRIEKLLVSLGFNISTGSVSGKIVDSAGPVQSILVKVGDKSDITDGNGEYKVSRLPLGNLPITVQNPRIDKTYPTFPATINIKDNRQITNINVRLNIPKRRIKGKVMINNAPLKNGYINATDGYTTVTFKLNQNGEFLDYLKENQYALTIRDSNYKIVNVTNSGNLGDITKLKVVDKNLDSMIWVR